MVIELDGQYHMNPINEEKDSARTKKLKDFDFKVIRFENRSVFDKSGVGAGGDKEKFQERWTTPSACGGHPSLKKGGELFGTALLFH